MGQARAGKESQAGVGESEISATPAIRRDVPDGHQRHRSGLHHPDHAIHRAGSVRRLHLPSWSPIVIDIALQLNVWRVIGVSGLRAQELGNRVLPGVGHLLAFFVVLGGFVFNVGNVAGAGLGTRCDARARSEVGRRALGVDRHRHISVTACRHCDGSHRRSAWLRDDRDDGLRGDRLASARRRGAAQCRLADRDRFPRDHDARGRHGWRLHHVCRRASPARRRRAGPGATSRR